MTAVTLFIPGLFGPCPQYSDELIPELDALSLLLSRARPGPAKAGTAGQSPLPSWYRTVYSLLGYQPPEAGDVPVAAITRLVDSDEVPAGRWMRVDPVRMAADRDGVALMDSSTFSLDRRDALALAGEIKDCFAEAGLELEALSPHRWYVKINNAAAVMTTEPDRVTGNAMLEFLPKGADGKQWHGLMNEIQMALHKSEVNRLREERGDPPVNSLWFWGVGELPEARRPHFSRVYSDETFVEGMAKLSNLPCRAVPESINDLRLNAGDDASLFVDLRGLQGFARYFDVTGWREALSGYEQNWFSPAREHLRQKRLKKLIIHADDKTFSLTPFSLKKIWKRKKTFPYFVARSA